MDKLFEAPTKTQGVGKGKEGIAPQCKEAASAQNARSVSKNSGIEMRS